LTGSTPSDLNDVAASVSEVYNVGADQSGNATLWITDLNGNVLSQTALSSAGGGNTYVANAAAIDSSQVYIVGTQTNGAVSTPLLWIIAYSGTQIAGSPFTLGANATGEGVAVNGSNVFIVGTTTSANANPNTAILWETDLSGAGLASTLIETGMATSSASDVALSSTTIYVSGQLGNTSTGNAALWTMPVGGPVASNAIVLNGPLNTPHNPPDNTGVANAVAFSTTTNMAYIVGASPIDNTSFSTLWIYDPGLTTQALQTLGPQFDYQGSAIILSSGAAYVIGIDGQGLVPLWITDLSGNLVSTTYMLPGSGGDADGHGLTFTSAIAPVPTPNSSSSKKSSSCVVPPNGHLYDINRLKKAASRAAGG
jgi:hypothetical protein